MKIELTSQQKYERALFRAFVDEQVVPRADAYDREGRTPPELIGAMARNGYLGAVLPVACGGAGMDAITFGLLNEEIGRGCSSLRSLLTVHSMVCEVVSRWGSKRQRERWLARLARGESIAAFALSEPNVGSDAASVETSATASGDYYKLSGHKKWISYGQIADLFLVFAQCDGSVAAFLVERETPELSITPISGISGTRASMLAELHLNNCPVPKENLVSRAGLGLAVVASTALTLGRYSVACGCVGIAQACLEACVRYTSERRQFGSPLKEHQLIKQMMTDMLVGVRAARLLCHQAGYLKDAGEPNASMEISMAKYFASTVAVKAAGDAVQIHGANGCLDGSPVQRYLRDAKIMEIIEGSTQIQQINIAPYAYQDFQA